MKKKKIINVITKGQKFSIIQIIGNFIQPTYKIDMCPLACLITRVFHMFFLIALI
jgi:hypothetical protein